MKDKVYTCSRASCNNTADIMIRGRIFQWMVCACNKCYESMKNEEGNEWQDILNQSIRTVEILPLKNGKLTAVDINDILGILIKNGKARKTIEGYEGEYNSDADNDYLTPEQQSCFLAVLHQANPHNDEVCSGLHIWNIKLLEIN